MTTVTNHSRYLSSHLDTDRSTYPVLGRRRLGNTGLVVGEIGVGTSALEASGFASVPDEELRHTLGLALDMQAGFFDVSADAGDGRILRQLGFAMQGRRHQAQVCLRVAGDADALKAGTERALRQLASAHVDVLLWDRPGYQNLKAQDHGWQALAGLKRDGKAVCVGASLRLPEELRTAVEQTPCEVLQFPLNVFDQANAAVLDSAAAKGVGLVAVQPLCGGWLSGRFGAGHLFMDARRRWSRGDRARRAALQPEFEALVAQSGTTAAQAALQFVLSYPQVACAVAGVSAWQQVVGNVDAASERLAPSAVTALRDLWERRIRDRPLEP